MRTFKKSNKTSGGHLMGRINLQHFLQSIRINFKGVHYVRYEDKEFIRDCHWDIEKREE